LLGASDVLKHERAINNVIFIRCESDCPQIANDAVC
jgi:hypothetical protein